LRATETTSAMTISPVRAAANHLFMTALHHGPRGVRYAGGVSPEPVSIALPSGGSVSGLWLAPGRSGACVVLAHGAGVGMAHKSMVAIAEGLAERGIASLRYNFPYMERQSRRVDAPPIAHAAVRAAAVAAKALAGGAPLFAGGRSFGARMTSQAQAKATLDGVRGLVFFAFPLHPANQGSEERAVHLREVDLPMLFLQGTRDALAEAERLARVVGQLGPRAELAWLEDADHSFHVRAGSGRSDAAVMAEALDRAADWMLSH
jgi:hypothetical protein